MYEKNEKTEKTDKFDKKNINYTNNDGAKYRYSAPRKETEKKTEKTEKIKEALTKRAVFWRTNRVFAVIVLIAVIILFSALSMYRAMSSRRSDVEKYYPDVKTVAATVVSGAKSLASLSEAVNPGSALNSEARELIAKTEKESETPYWSDATLLSSLRDKCEAIYNLMIYGSGTKDAKSAAEEYYGNVNAAFRSLGTFSGYDEAAREFNRAASTFPMKLFGLDRAPVFEQTGEASADDDGGGFLSGVMSTVAKLSAFQIIVIVAVIAIAVGSVIGRKRQ